MRSASAADSGRLFARIRARGRTWALAIAIALLQYPLWLGQGGWLQVREGMQKIELQRALNQRLQTRNASLLAELNDLKQGRDAIEERARNDLGMMAPDEWFVRVVRPNPSSRENKQ
ncbi:cell division protein FtsB [Thiobacillus sedimenti]|uniref:Cell division protein FtsB n=1 Tax=Thiobacillus sedimenti TaxID=3110231 RepID=A0ABZ1CKY7_9PROT|nr:cell division protein FtsB [Thiobacillus sp. SCUT-2]WRS39937.1 cell division protein FtsB [Thiobacillus sp. SCUT-2]